MPIPKKIYQTWFTRDLPEPLQENIVNFLKMNPEYEYELYTDDDMDNFVRENYPGEIYDCYSKLNIIVAKADFWRYLVLYKYGGIYVDIDGDIMRPLDNLINPDDSAIITAECNPFLFVQWALMFESGHPILKEVIEIVVDNIKNSRHPYDLHQLTGPSAFSLAIYKTHDANFDTELVHSDITNKTDVTYDNGKVKYRIFGQDYNGYCHYDNPYKQLLFVDKEYWRQEQKYKSCYKNMPDRTPPYSGGYGGGGYGDIDYDSISNFNRN
jgi:mannosyltransferase OCH1-like enzyme